MITIFEGPTIKELLGFLENCQDDVHNAEENSPKATFKVHEHGILKPFKTTIFRFELVISGNVPNKDLSRVYRSLPIGRVWYFEGFGAGCHVAGIYCPTVSANVKGIISTHIDGA